jgi:hypothetical protein
VLDEKDSDESAIRLLTLFQEPIEPAVVVEPGKTSFDLPPLATVPPVVLIFGGSPPGDGDMVFAIGGIGNDTTLPQFPPQRLTIIPFVEP